jgi:arylsulfatase A-like enzyme
MNKMQSDERPNIIIILADDLGFSDIGCFGSEIQTPHIDSLAYSKCGMRFTQFYNCARCCPSRAALLTGKYPHQAGIGHMMYDAGVGAEYQGFLKKDVATIAELLKQRGEGGHGAEGNNTREVESIDNCSQPSKDERGGYATFMVGKWHVGGEYPPDASHDWVQTTLGDELHPIPTQRGFDRHYGTLGGGGSYYQPPSLVRDQEVVRDVMPEGYYYTDAINDEACSIIESSARKKDDDRRPFFLYVAHCAPHWYVDFNSLFLDVVEFRCHSHFPTIMMDRPLHAPKGKDLFIH